MPPVRSQRGAVCCQHFRGSTWQWAPRCGSGGGGRRMQGEHPVPPGTFRDSGKYSLGIVQLPRASLPRPLCAVHHDRSVPPPAMTASWSRTRLVL